ncbi:MAG: alpha/beta hydrolase [Candidatus Omnitrophica bacterium]|nr:alpha/beta hydrolase [Candidatus Omnitrophota bacterium]
MMAPPLFSNAFVISILLLLVFWGFRLFEYHSVYQPMKTIELAPGDLGVDYEEVAFVTGDNVTVHGWFFRDDKARANILFCHGNAGNISHRLEIVKVLKTLRVNILLFDYRGYGRSTGRPSEEGTYADALAAFSYLQEREDTKGLPVVMYGESLGGAIAVETALRKKTDGVILESTFTSVPALGKELYPFLPTALLCRIRYDSLSKISRIDCPKLIIHSADDELVSVHHAEQLYAQATEPKTLFIRRGSHNEGMFVNPQASRDTILAFLQKHVFL